MNNATDYQTIYGYDHSSFVARVKAELLVGWQLLGGVSISCITNPVNSNQTVTFFAQAMVK